MKDAASAKTSKTDGRTLLANSPNLRDTSEDDSSTTKAAAAGDADNADKASTTDNDSAVVATGFCVVADYTDKLPANDFFTPGRVIPVRVKHSNFPGEFWQVFS